MIQPRFKFPIINRIVLRNFSLYTQLTEIDLQVTPGVFCIVGANGLGKSTFIAAVNFAICGRVPEPGRTFQSAEEYFQESERFSSAYFSGRITESDRLAAEIEIEFTVGEDVFSLVRGAFEPNQLRSLKIQLEGSSIDPSPSLSPSQVNDLYRSNLANSVGVATFEQFVFLQLFVFTFDERRHLTFWEQPVQRQLLLLAFGDDVASSERAENLRRRAERLDSNARNFNYQATDALKRLTNTQRALAGIDPETLDLRARHEQLETELTGLLQRESNWLTEISDSKLGATELRARSNVLRNQIDEVFHARGHRTRNLMSRPIVAESVASSNCHLCGASGEQIPQSIRARISLDSCPLCGTDLPPETIVDPAVESLQQLDQELSDIGESIEEEISKQQRLQSEVNNLQAGVSNLQQQITQFEREHLSVASRLGSTDVVELQASIDANQRVVRELTQKKDDARSERDVLLKELRGIQERLANRYASSESKFVSSFTRLAQAFIGLDLDVKLDLRGNDVFLVLDVAGQTRREQFQLSESQRFFVDIALRMTIIKYMATEIGSGVMLIDTPEGSLDIAYESRAGEMFAQFVEDGFNIIMTANINTSLLLRRLAIKCGAKSMHVEKMTEWTDLSEVQQASEHLFTAAYAQLQNDLATGGK